MAQLSDAYAVAAIDGNNVSSPGKDTFHPKFHRHFRLSIVLDDRSRNASHHVGKGHRLTAEREPRIETKVAQSAKRWKGIPALTCGRLLRRFLRYCRELRRYSV